MESEMREKEFANCKVVCTSLPAIPNLLTITMSDGISVVNPFQGHLELFDHSKQIAPIIDEISHIPSYSLSEIELNSLNFV